MHCLYQVTMSECILGQKYFLHFLKVFPKSMCPPPNFVVWNESKIMALSEIGI
ncbi:unnamed protein product [Meloidogyne enterolobii]|uniref:Uncharacterized protein n=1 Tax=Meloidogyne enterolobii TaxID=390850 RepID=A0ACB0Z5J4_MELEN